MADRSGSNFGNYHLIRLLGRGGFADVYLGEHVRLHSQAAIKVMHTSLADEDRDIFLREAQTVARLKHPHIVRVFDFDVEQQTPFLVMDFLPNGNVRRSHPKGTRLPLQTIVSYVNQVASALQYAHSERLIHRDIKPENMLIDRDNSLVLSDFGIALMTQSSRFQSTQEVAGTAAYMAPEQFQGKPRRASDQYSLGVVVFEWLTGDHPFHGTFSEIASQHLFVPPPLREQSPGLWPEISQVVMRALDKDPQRRYENIQDFAFALEQAVKSLPSDLTLRPLGPGPGDLPATLVISGTEAIYGAQRTLTLPGGDRINVQVPPGAYDGQVIRLAQRGNAATSYGAPMGALILTLSVQQVEQLPSAVDIESMRRTMQVSHSHLQLPSVPQGSSPTVTGGSPPSVPAVSHPGLPLYSVASSPPTPPFMPFSDHNIAPMTAPPPPSLTPVQPEYSVPQPSGVNVRVMVMIGLVLLVILSSVGLFAALQANQEATTRANATTTAEANGHSTADAQSTSGVQQQQTIATQNALATQQVINATATSQAQISATATAFASNSAPYGGTLVFDDPLQVKNGQNRWGEDEHCKFKNDAFTAQIAQDNYLWMCLATSVDFSNFAYQAQARIVNGDAGGIAFRGSIADPSKYHGYTFVVRQDGYYEVCVYPPNATNCTVLMSGPSAAIKQGLNEVNVLAVKADGNTYTFYINGHDVGTTTDSTFSHGFIGVTANDFTKPTEVWFNNAKVWKL